MIFSFISQVCLGVYSTAAFPKTHLLFPVFYEISGSKNRLEGQFEREQDVSVLFLKFAGIATS